MMSVLMMVILCVTYSVTALADSSIDVIQDFSDGLACMKKSDLYGFIDSKGNWVIEPIYESASNFVNGYAKVRKNGSYYYIDTSGTIVSSSYNFKGDATDANEGLAVVSYGEYPRTYYEYVRIYGSDPTPKSPSGNNKYVTAKPFSEGLAYVEISTIPTNATESYDNRKEMMIDYSGNAVIDFGNGLLQLGSDTRLSINYIYSVDFIDGYALVPGTIYNNAGTYSYGEGYIIIDKNGQRQCIIYLENDSCRVYNCGNGIFVYVNPGSDTYYYMDAQGNRIIDETFCCVYTDHSSSNILRYYWSSHNYLFNDGIALVGIDRKGKVVPTYININGETVFPSDGWSDAQPFSEGLAAVCKDGKWGYIDTSGQYVIEPKYQSARSFSDGVAIVDETDEWFIIDTKGEVLY